MPGYFGYRCLEPDHKTGLFPHKTFAALKAEVSRLKCLECKTRGQSGVKRRAEDVGEEVR